MAKGYWLPRTTGIYATGGSPYHFDKLSRNLNRRGKNCHTREYFVPQWECTQDFRSKNIPCQQDINSDVLDQLVANVDFTNKEVDQQNESLNKALKRAKIEKTQADTKLQNEKLEQRKKLLFAQWSERFFDEFSNHFGKMRNVLISLHLNEDQVKLFNETLQNCIDNLQVNLDNIWQDFDKENQNETEEI